MADDAGSEAMAVKTQSWNPNEVEGAFAGWDPRKEHYLSYQGSTVESEGPLANFCRSSNLARTKDNVSEPYGLYVRNVPLNMKPENLQHLFSEYGKVLSVYVRKHKPEQSNYRTTWAILKVESMREVIAMIGGLNDKPPLNLKVELSLTEEERARRRRERDLDQQFQQEMEQMTASRMDASSIVTQGGVAKQQNPKEVPTRGAGRGRIFSSMYEGISPGNREKVSNSSSYTKGLPDQRNESSVLRASEVSKSPDDAVVEIGCGSVAVGYRRPHLHSLWCVGQLRCSICKAWYCGKLCQVDDSSTTREKCSPPQMVAFCHFGPLEDADSYSNYLLLESQNTKINEVNQSMQDNGILGNESKIAAPDFQTPSSFSSIDDDGPLAGDPLGISTPLVQNGQNSKVSGGGREGDYLASTKDAARFSEKTPVSEKLMSSRKINSQSEDSDWQIKEALPCVIIQAKIKPRSHSQPNQVLIHQLLQTIPIYLQNNSLVDKVQVGCQYQAVISNLIDFRTFINLDGPLIDFPGLSMIGKLHALCTCTQIKHGRGHDMMNNSSEGPSIKGSIPTEAHLVGTKQPSKKIADVCKFIPHSVLVSKAGKENGYSLLSTGNRVGETPKGLEIGSKTEKPFDHSSPKATDDMQGMTCEDRATGDGGKYNHNPESKQRPALLPTPKEKPCGVTKRFWACELPSTFVEQEKEYTVLPIWLTEENMLYVQIVSESTVEAFGKLLYDMNNHCEKGKAPDSITVGEVVCGFVTSEGMWYRCEVVALDNQQITVHLCDFGNYEQIPKKQQVQALVDDEAAPECILEEQNL
ncbi:uncharacterized protein LOC122242397 [Penaeus japonicus]|uniref:uncharacterized protein LOC122242397 n=1 Tax=Penaeus japonicus TaxID=27405 RepID=UPI001C70B59B|nr:uncharacterized protein LOC122242397 [Penaeus japonicus]